MTDDEMIEDYAKGLCKTCTVDTCRYNTLQTCAIKESLKQAYLAGLKAGRPKWHKVADGDLPKDENDVLVYSGEDWRMCVGRYSPNQKSGGRMKVYIAGKITGESRASVAEKFSNAMCKLKSAGHLPFNPSVLPDYEQVDHADYMHVCYAMIDVCDAIYMLKDWQTSAGARAELQYAAEWKKKIMYEDENTREEGFPIVYGG